MERKKRFSLLSLAMILTLTCAGVGQSVHAQAADGGMGGMGDQPRQKMTHAERKAAAERLKAAKAAIENANKQAGTPTASSPKGK